MICLTPDECVNWIKGQLHDPKSIMLDAGFPRLPFPGYRVEKCEYPKDSGKKVGLARLVFQLLDTDSDLFLWLQNWNVWPSCGHVPLLLRLRQGLGENRTLDQAPGHLLPKGERDDALSILILSLEFYWDCLVVETSGRLAFFTSHDEYCGFMSNEEAIMLRVRQSLNVWK